MGTSRLKAEENRRLSARWASLERSQGVSAAPEGESVGAGESCLVPRAFKRLQACSTRFPCPAPGQHRRIPKQPPSSSSGVWLQDGAGPVVLLGITLSPGLCSEGRGRVGSPLHPAPRRGPGHPGAAALLMDLALLAAVALAHAAPRRVCRSSVAAVVGLSSPMGSRGAGGGRKPGSALGLRGSFPSFGAGTEHRVRKEPWDAVSCRDMSQQ